MLYITVPERELFDEKASQFMHIKEQTISLEHSLVSISKWEAKWEKPFLKSDKTDEEVIDYIRCMTLTQKVDPYIYYGLTQDNIKAVNDYISKPMTAQRFYGNGQTKSSNETMTSELIYYLMIELRIPIEFQKWHLNRLLALIRLCESKHQPPKKMSQREIMARNSALNAERRAKMHSRG